MEETFELEQAGVPLWAWLVAAAAILVAYAVTMDNGAVLGRAASNVHELFHDARHFVGVPCH
jgi:Probable cobalt transporter subunit (CbtB)